MNGPAATYQRTDTEAEYRDAICRILAGARGTIYVLDRDLSRMGLERRPALDHLAAFLRGREQRQLHIALHHTAFLETAAPRLFDLLADHAHVAAVRCVPESFRQLADCHVLADNYHGVRRFHADHPRCATAFDNPTEIAPWWARFEELWALTEGCLKSAKLPL